MAGKRNPRLSLVECDKVGKASASGGLAEEYAELIGKLEADHPGSKVVSVKSCTDKDRQRRKSFADKDQVAGGTEGELTANLEFLKSKNIGVSCRKGMKPEAPNQDSFTLLVVEDVFALYGVFDGHGPFGHDVSDQARDILVCEFMKHEERRSNTKKAFEDSFPLTQEKLKEKFKTTEIAVSGSTCTMAYHDVASGIVTVAHIGDSRSVLVSQVQDKLIEALTVDHKPETPSEKTRIEAQGGRVEFDGFYNYRVFAKGSQSPGLNMSRAFGDVYAHTSAGLTASPEVKEIALAQYSAAHEKISLLLCSDGVWEFIPNEEVSNVIKGQSSALEAANVLAQESYKRWMDDSGNEVADDITVVLVEIPLK